MRVTTRRLLVVLATVGAVLFALVPLVANYGPTTAASGAGSVLHVYKGFTLISPSPTPTARPTSTTDWPQVQKDPQRTGYTQESLGSSFPVKWTHPFQPERVYPQVQPIVYDGTVFVGTEMGNLYALDASDGETLWSYLAGGPIVGSAAADNGRVFFGSLDGAVYALDVHDGSLVWKRQLSTRLGFVTSPVIADGRLMLGGQDGWFYGLACSDGSLLWQYDVGAPILQTAAWDDGKAFFGAMDLRVYAVDTDSGNLAWTSGKLPGVAFKDYWPVVTQGKVLVRPMTGGGGVTPGFPFSWFSSADSWNWLARNGATVAAGNLTQVTDAMSSQDVAIARYRSNPAGYTKSLFVLDEATGQDAESVPSWSTQTMNGATTPPCVARDNTVVVPVMFVRSGWGRLDLARQRLVDVLYDGTSTSGQPMSPNQTPAGFGNQDENLNVTCTANAVLAMHTQEGNANYTGVFNLDSRRWVAIAAGQRNRQMSSNTQGGGGNPASVSNGVVYHISWHELIARAVN